MLRKLLNSDAAHSAFRGDKLNAEEGRDISAVM